MEDYLYPFIEKYMKLPSFVRLGLGKLYATLPASFRHGKFYTHYQKRIHQFQQAKDTKSHTLQHNKLLRETLIDASKNIPFYKNLTNIHTEADLLKFPVIDKKTLTNAANKLINTRRLKNALPMNSGGSTGQPLSFYLQKGVSRSKEKAHFNWYWSQFGYHHADPILMVRGRPLPENKLHIRQPIDNKLVISCYTINKTNILHAVEQIRLFKPKFIHAYPSSLKVLTDYLEESGPNPANQIEKIFLGSEYLPPAYRKRFEDYYGAQCINWYGHSERLIHAGNCMHSTDYHIYPFYGHLELLDSDNAPILKPHQTGRIVATGFDNRVMPLIRYDTGDLAEWSEKEECPCGFKGRSLKNIQGRSQDYIVLTDHSKISLTAFFFGQHLEEMETLQELQMVQKTPGKLLIKIVERIHTTQNQKDALADKLEKSVAGKIHITVETVERIEKTHRGKHIFLIQEINSHETGNPKF